jgi:EAL domain-containing protein (putative c-di-GMP-specific phosphodiesterase class I)
MKEIDGFSSDELYNAYKRFRMVLEFLNGNLEVAKRMLTSFNNHFVFMNDESLRQEAHVAFLMETDQVNELMIDLGEEFEENVLELIERKIKKTEEKVSFFLKLLKEAGDSRVSLD